MPLDSETALFLAGLAKVGFRPFHQSAPGEIRSAMASLRDAYGHGPEMACADDVTIPVDDGFIGARVLVPRGPVSALIIYFHGGGWVCGGPDDYDTLGRKLADRTACAVVLVDYRLAPEHRYPVAADDAFAALNWVAGNVSRIVGADVPLVVAGDSAGGNLAAATVLRARDRGGPAVSMQILVYPVTDADLSYPSYGTEENQRLVTRADMAWFWDQYLPDQARRSESWASPMRAPSHIGLPPTLLISAEFDATRDDGEAYGEKLRCAGVDVRHKRFAGQIHGFFSLLMLPGADEALDWIAAEMAVAGQR